MTKYIARAYIGLAWLDDVDEFDNKEDALTCLEKYLERGIDMEMSDEEIANWEETFWANSRIDEVSDEF